MAILPPELWMIIFKHLRRLYFLDRIRKIESTMLIHKPSVTMSYGTSPHTGLNTITAIAVLNIFITHKVTWFTGLSTHEKIYWREACIHGRRKKKNVYEPDRARLYTE